MKADFWDCAIALAGTLLFPGLGHLFRGGYALGALFAVSFAAWQMLCVQLSFAVYFCALIDIVFVLRDQSKVLQPSRF